MICLAQSIDFCKDPRPLLDEFDQHIIRVKVEPGGLTARDAVVTLYGTQPAGTALNVSGVDLSVEENGSLIWRGMMSPLTGMIKRPEAEPLQIYKAIARRPEREEETDIAFTLTFIVNRASTVKTFKHQLRDSLYSQQLWASCVNKEWTDVEFQVGNRIFAAHRAIVTARCPNLASLIPDFVSGPVPVHTMDPSVFQDLLYFLYTGELECYPTLDRLLAAENYQIETLNQLGQQRCCLSQDQLSDAVLMSV